MSNMTKTDNLAEVGMHVFERAGLGKAPFRCVGYSENFITHPDGSTQAAGSCDYCGTGIRHQCQIRSRDGRLFKVGSDCVAKTGDAGLLRSYKTLPAVREANRAKARAKDERVCAEWKSLIEAPATVEKLSARLVPGRPWVPGEQVTLLDSMKRLWGMCGAAGRQRTLKTLKGHLDK
jgi:hypothetical protein